MASYETRIDDGHDEDGLGGEGGAGGAVRGGRNEGREDMFDEDGNLIDPDSAEGIKMKHVRRKERAEAKEAQLQEDVDHAATLQRFGVSPGDADDDAEQARLREEKEALPTMKGMISRAFDPYMIAVVRHERSEYVATRVS